MTAMFPFVVTLAGGGREAAQPFELLGAELDAVGGCVLLDAGDPFGSARYQTPPATAFHLTG